jgi:ribonuclease D
MLHTRDAVDSADSNVDDTENDVEIQAEIQVEPKVPHETREPVPELISTQSALLQYAQALSGGSGPLALDAERASGYTYSQRAYLIQLRRAGAGTALIDPIACPDLSLIAEATVGVEWILHAATQDLDCLREVGLTPSSLFDTELAGRILGRERVGLGPLMENELGVYLEKGHGAADWSQRPFSEAMLRYAALDVELLVELRDALAASLDESGKREYAQQEFDALLTWRPREHKGEAWRRTSGVHSAKTPLARGIVRELWLTRDDIARRRDIAPGRILPDRAILAAALAKPADQLLKVQGFNGRGAGRYEKQWVAAVERARSLPESELPQPPPRSEGPPPPKAWADKNPGAHARLEFTRVELARISEELNIPTENLMQPDLVRRACWAEPLEDQQWYINLLREGGARQWQCDLVLPILLLAREQQADQMTFGDLV